VATIRSGNDVAACSLHSKRKSAAAASMARNLSPFPVFIKHIYLVLRTSFVSLNVALLILPKCDVHLPSFGVDVTVLTSKMRYGR
jgi:hypothetical protein